MLYDRIRELCRAKGITISMLERELGFSKGYISKIDKHKPSMERMTMIADYLGVDMRNIFADEVPTSGQYGGYYEDVETAKVAQEIFENPDMRILFDAARDSKPEDLRRAADLLKRFKQTNPEG